MAKKIQEEDLRLNIIVNGDKGRKEILDLENKISDITNSLRSMRKEQKMLADAGQTDSDRYKELTKQIKAESAALKTNKERLETLRRQMSVNNMTIEELTKRARNLRVALSRAIPGSEDFKRLQKELAEVNGRLNELRNQAGSTGGIVKGLGSAITKTAAGIGVAYAAIRRAFGFVATGVRTITDFEQANVNLSTILGKNVGQIFDLTNQAMQLGRTTRYTASEVTGLQTELAKLGFTQKEILSMTAPILNFATAVGSELPEAAALAGATLRMFGLRATDADKVLGTLALSTNKSALSFSYLQTAMSIVGPVARTFGFSVKDTVTLLGALANAGFDASSAATATRNILLNLADSSGKLAKRLGEPVRTLPDLLSGLQRLNDQGIDLATTLDLTDKRSVAAFNTFLHGADSATILRGELEETDGVLQDIAEKRMNTVDGSIKTLQSTWEGFILSLRNSRGFIKSTIDLLSDFVRKITPKDDTDPTRTTARAADYVSKLWNGYDGDDNKRADAITKIIAEDEKKAEQALKNAEAKLENASGILAKRRAKKEVQYWTEGLAVYAAARDELTDRQRWEIGNYNEDTGGSGSSDPAGGPHGDDDKKHKHQWSLQNDESFLKAKAALTKQFNEGEIKTQEAYNEELYQLEVSTLTARIAARKERGADLQKIESELQDKIMAHNTAAAKKEQQLMKDGQSIIFDAAIASKTAAEKALANEEKSYASEKEKFKGHKDVLEAIERKHQAAIAKIRAQAEDESLQKMQAAHDLEKQQIENRWTERIAAAKKGSGEELSLQKEMAKELAQNDLNYLEALRKKLQEITDTGKLDGIDIPEDQQISFQKKLADIIKQINAAKQSIKGQDNGIMEGTGGGSLFGVGQAQWEQLFYNLEQGKFKAEDLGSVLQGLGGMAQEGMKLAGKAIELTNAKEQAALKEYIKGNDKKKSELEKRLSAGLMTQDQYEAEVKKLDEDREAREEEMALKQAERQKKLSLIQAIINTALGVTQTLAQWGIPWGIAPAAIMAAMGAAEVAMIAATPVSGRERGGPFGDDSKTDDPIIVRRKQDGRPFPARLDPSRRGFINRPTVLVGENGSEYVIPHEALENPSIRPFINSIETARQNGQLKSLRLEAIRPEVTVTGRASGGFVSAGTDSGGLPSGMTTEGFTEMLTLLRKMNVIFSKSIKADVSMLGRHGIVETLEEYMRLKKKGQL